MLCPQINLGLELGQAIIVVAATTLLFVLCGRPRYPAWAIHGGSLAALLVGRVWFIEVTADLSRFPWPEDFSRRRQRAGGMIVWRLIETVPMGE